VKRGQALGRPNPHYRGGVHLHFELLVPNPPAGGIYNCSNRPGIGCDLNPTCFFSPAQRSKLKYDATSTSCRRQGSAAPNAWCDAYGLTLAPATIHQPGTAIRRKEAGEAGPPTTADVDGVRPDASGLTNAQQAKFQQTEQNRYRYGWDKYVIKAAAEQGVDQALLLGLITQESLGDPLDISSTGCAGLMQICIRTAQHLAGLAGHVTPCDCAGKGPSCKCAPENDRRLLPEYAVPAGATLLKRNLNAFANARDTETQWAFALAAYNGGPSVVNRAIRATGKPRPSWEEVAEALKKHPELYTGKEAKTRAQKRAKMKQITTYVENVLAFAHAWNGGVAPVSAPSIEATKIGEYRVQDRFALPTGLESYLTLVDWAKRTIEECKENPVPGTCVTAAMKKQGVMSACPDDAATLSLYEALRDCAENAQDGCQCTLPQPVTATIRSKTWNTTLGNLSLDEPFGTRTVRVETDDQTEGVEPDKLVFKDGKLTFTYDKEETTWEPGWTVEKNDAGNLIFRQSASGAEACAPVKREYTFCKAFAQGVPAARFALTIRDDTPPAPPTGLAVQDGKVFFTPSVSPDASFYNVYDQAPGAGVRPVAQVLNAAASSFDASTYTGKTLYVTTVDQAGNEGDAASVKLGGATKSGKV